MHDRLLTDHVSFGIPSSKSDRCICYFIEAQLLPVFFHCKNNEIAVTHLLCQVCSLSLVGLVLGTLPSGTIEQAEKTFKNTRTQGFYYRTIPSDECKYLFFLPIFFSY